MAPYTVVVVAHDRPRQLLAALAALRLHARPAETLVVDNGSTVQLNGVIALSQTPARLIRLNEHQSLGAAYNAAIDAAANDVVMLIHSDLLLESDPAPVVSWFAQSATVGVAGGKLLEPGDEPRRITQAGYAAGRGRINPQPIAERAWDTFHAPRDVIAVSTACMIVRRTDVRFDERYWFCLEDVDLCHQYAQRGLETWFVPTLTATHLERGGARERASDPIWAQRRIISHMLYQERWCSTDRLDTHPRQPAVRGEAAAAYLSAVDAALRRRYPTPAA